MTRTGRCNDADCYWRPPSARRDATVARHDRCRRRPLSSVHQYHPVHPPTEAPSGRRPRRPTPSTAARCCRPPGRPPPRRRPPPAAPPPRRPPPTSIDPRLLNFIYLLIPMSVALGPVRRPSWSCRADRAEVRPRLVSAGQHGHWTCTAGVEQTPRFVHSPRATRVPEHSPALVNDMTSA